MQVRNDILSLCVRVEMSSVAASLCRYKRVSRNRFSLKILLGSNACKKKHGNQHASEENVKDQIIEWENHNKYERFTNEKRYHLYVLKSYLMLQKPTRKKMCVKYVVKIINSIQLLSYLYKIWYLNTEASENFHESIFCCIILPETKNQYFILYLSSWTGMFLANEVSYFSSVQHKSFSLQRHCNHSTKGVVT